MNIRDVQQLLAEAGIYTGPIDGDAGPLTLTAVQTALRKSAAVVSYGWPKARQIIAAGQVILTDLGYQPGMIDGLPGHLTAEALTAYLTSPRPGAVVVPRIPGPDYLLTDLQARYPRQADMAAYYGPAGGPDCTRGTVRLPMPFIIAWDPEQTLTSFHCHVRLAAPITSIFADAHAHYGPEMLAAMGLTTFGGCFNMRRMRGGSSMSMHSWGAAVDLDPLNNQLRWGRDRARFAAQEYDPFWQIVEAHGAVSLGRAANRDWMHFQFARL